MICFLVGNTILDTIPKLVLPYYRDTFPTFHEFWESGEPECSGSVVVVYIVFIFNIIFQTHIKICHE